MADELKNYLEKCGLYLNDILAWHLLLEAEENQKQYHRSPGLDLNLDTSIE